MLLLLLLVVSNWNGEADEDGASTRWSELASEANERTSERASGWTYAASATVAAGATSRQTSFTHNQTGAHTHTQSHTRYRAVCGSGCCLSCLRALSLALFFSLSLSHLLGLVIELEPYSSLLDLLFRYLCVCSMRVCVRTCVCSYRSLETAHFCATALAAYAQHFELCALAIIIIINQDKHTRSHTHTLCRTIINIINNL